MSSTIGSSYSGYSTSQLASNLFSKLDTKKQGYIEQSDLQSAFEQIGGTSYASEVENVFSQLDGDSDGKVTESELSDTLTKLAEELDNQFNQSRMQAAGGMPPPPPPAEKSDSTGFTQDELQSQLEEIGSTESQRSSLISNIVNNFDEADTNSDGKVSNEEAMAYDQKTSSTTTASDSTTTASQTDTETSVRMRLMQLIQAYGIGDSSYSGLNSLLSTEA